MPKTGARDFLRYSSCLNKNKNKNPTQVGKSEYEKVSHNLGLIFIVKMTKTLNF